MLLFPLPVSPTNTSKHAVTGYTPFFLVHGHEARLPVDVATGIETTRLFPVDSYVENQMELLNAAFKKAKENVKTASEEMVRRQRITKTADSVRRGRSGVGSATQQLRQEEAGSWACRSRVQVPSYKCLVIKMKGRCIGSGCPTERKLTSTTTG